MDVQEAIDRLEKWNSWYDLAHTGHAGFDSAADAWNVLTAALCGSSFDDNVYLSDDDYPDAALDGEEYADFLDRAASANRKLVDGLIAEVRTRFEASRG